MFTKQDHINYWKQTADDSWDSAEYLMSGKKFPEALFMYCLAIEKWLKAKWVKDNINNYPPRIHDLHSIYAETDLQLETDHLDFMDTVNRWNLEGRYPDYRFSLKKDYNRTIRSKATRKIENFKGMYTKRDLKSLLENFKGDLILNGMPPKKLFLFGSYVNGGVHKYSDVDVAIWSDQFTGDVMADFEKVQPVLKKYTIVQAKLYPALADENNFDPFIGEIKRTGISIL